MTKDWDAVAGAIDARLQDLGMTQMELATRAGVALATVRELHRNLHARRRSRNTLSAISEALGWPSNYLWDLSSGRSPSPHPDEGGDPVLQTLRQMQVELDDIRSRLAAIERQVSDEGGDA